MERFFIIYSLVGTIATLCLLAALVVGDLHRKRRYNRDAALQRKYLQVLMLSLTADGDESPSLPMLQCTGARRLLTETIAGLIAVTSGLDTAPLKYAVEKHGLDKWLLHRVRYSQGYRRAYYLALLACLPVGEQVVAQVARYAHSRNRYVRFYALMAQLAAEPSTSLRRMSEYGQAFSACEVSEIITLLRRGMLPIAYEPLIASPNRNLRMVGLGIVRQFGIEEAEKQLLCMVASDRVPELGREALYTLCAMRLSLTRHEVATRIATMNRAERKSLLRYMAQGGYSPSALQRLFDEQERPYYESIVHSYKRNLVC